MNKVNVAIAVAIFFLGMASAAFGQIEKGNIMVDAYYGFPNSTKSFYTIYSDEANFRSRGFGPVGIRAEYMVADKIGLGLEANVVQGGCDYTANGFNYSYTKTKIRTMARFNFHFFTRERFDMYTAFGAGYRHAIRTFVTDDAGAAADDEELSSLNIKMPLALRAALGMKYFFIPNLGVSAEFGIGGGPLVNAGLALKF